LTRLRLEGSDSLLVGSEQPALDILDHVGFSLHRDIPLLLQQLTMKGLLLEERDCPLALLKGRHSLSALGLGQVLLGSCLVLLGSGLITEEVGDGPEKRRR
jgi:hypothetical protein